MIMGGNGTALRTMLSENTVLHSCELNNHNDGRFLSVEQQGIGGIFIVAECFLTDLKESVSK